MQYHEKMMVGAIGDNSDNSLKMTTIFQQVTINQFTTITTTYYESSSFCFW